MFSLNSKPQMNSQKNILSGPLNNQYWNHSTGLTAPMTREEGPWPILGNVGSLLKQETTNYDNCSTSLPNVGGSPNCTAKSAFVPDIYTYSNSCGDNCELKYPEAYGDQSFGMIKDDSGNYILTNAHAIHGYDNIRAISEGKGPSSAYGCAEWIPNLSPTSDGSCAMNPPKVYQQVGDWTKLAQNKNIVNYSFKSIK